MSEIEKYEGDELVYWTSIDGHIWHNDKVVQQLKQENEELKSKNTDLINANIGQHNFIKKQQQKQEKIKEAIFNYQKTINNHYITGLNAQILKIIESKE